MMQFFGRFMKLPLEAFVYSMEMFVKTVRGIQHIAFRGIDMMADWDVRVSGDASGSESVVPQVAAHEATHAVLEGAGRELTEATQVTMQETVQEERAMSDKDLRDDMLKLIRYKILFVKRDLEYAFPEKEELVSENTDAAGYTAWKVAEFIQKLNETEIPSKWRRKDFPRAVPETSPPGPHYINSLEEEDKKYLRVYYEVLERYQRERFRYEERQIEVLEQIRDKMKDP